MEWNEGKSSCLWRDRQSFGGSSKGQCVFVCFIQQRVWQAIQNNVMFIYSLLSLSTFLCILPAFFWACELRDFGCRSERNLCVFVCTDACIHKWHSFSEFMCESEWVMSSDTHIHNNVRAFDAGCIRSCKSVSCLCPVSVNQWSMMDPPPHKRAEKLLN